MIGKITQVIRPPQPETLFEKEIIKCASCDKDLVECVIVTEIEKEEEKWVFQCPFCNDSSFIRKYKNKTFFNGINKCKITSIEKDKDTWLVKLS